MFAYKHYYNTGRSCPFCGTEVEHSNDREYDYYCPECKEKLYDDECGNTMGVYAEDMKINEALERQWEAAYGER